MSFESTENEADFPGLYGTDPASVTFSEEVDQDKQKKRESLGGKKKDGKKEKKDKGYMVFEESGSDGEQALVEDVKSPNKGRKVKPPFRFAKKDIAKKSKDKDKEEKKEKEGKTERKKDDKEGKKHKPKEKKKTKYHAPAPPTACIAEKPVFGVPLYAAVENSKCHDGIELPAVFRECIDYIEEHGLTCEGIYRISGVKSKVQQLRECYNAGAPAYLCEHEPNIVASLLKQFLRDLPEPVLTSTLMPKFEDACANKIKPEQKVEMFRKLIAELPVCNNLLLSWMIVHMTHVIEHQKQNKMTLQNVSIVLSPTMQISHRVLNIFFSHVKQLFAKTTIKKYVPPLKPATSRWQLELPDNPAALEEELSKQDSLLSQLHEEMKSDPDDVTKAEQLWEVQRVVTQLKRKIKFARKATEAAEKRKKELDMFKKPASVSEVEELNFELQEEAADADHVTKQEDHVTKKCHVTKEDGHVTKEEDHVTKEEGHVTKEDGHVTKEDGHVTKEDGHVTKKEDHVTKEDDHVTSDAVGDERDLTPTNEVETSTVVDKNEPMKSVKNDDEPIAEEVTSVKAKDDVVNTQTNEPISADVSSRVEKFTKESEDVVEDEVEDVVNKDEICSLPQEAGQEIETKTTNIREEHESSSKEPSLEPVTSRDSERERDSHMAEPLQEQPKPRQKSKGNKVKIVESPDAKSSDATPLKKQAPPPPAHFQTSRELMQPIRLSPQKVIKKSVDTGPVDMTHDTLSAAKDGVVEEVDEEMQGLLDEEYMMVLEHEELLAIGDELRTKIETEHSEIERLKQEIVELQYLRQDSDLEDYSSSSDTSYESEDEEELQEILTQLISENEELEKKNALMSQKIHDEKMACLDTKVQIRLIQQKQLACNNILDSDNPM